MTGKKVTKKEASNAAKDLKQWQDQKEAAGKNKGRSKARSKGKK